MLIINDNDNHDECFVIVRSDKRSVYLMYASTFIFKSFIQYPDEYINI
jgi:hypothetical protein